jgi:hypothetical protein
MAPPRIAAAMTAKMTASTRLSGAEYSTTSGAIRSATRFITLISGFSAGPRCP